MASLSRASHSQGGRRSSVNKSASLSHWRRSARPCGPRSSWACPKVQPRRPAIQMWKNTRHQHALRNSLHLRQLHVQPLCKHVVETTCLFNLFGSLICIEVAKISFEGVEAVVYRHIEAAANDHGVAQLGPARSRIMAGRRHQGKDHACDR